MLAIVIYSLKRKLLRPIVVTNLILLPLLLILILGNALSATFPVHSSASASAKASASEQQKVSLAVIDQDNSEASRSLTSMLSAQGSAFEVSSSTSLSRVMEGLQSGKPVVAMRIASGFEAQRLQAKAATVELYAIDRNIDALRASEVALQAYSDVIRAQLTVMKNHVGAPHPFTLTDFSQTNTSKLEAAFDPSAGVTGITYYAVTILVLMLIYGIAQTMNFVTEEYVGPLGDRYLTSPVSKITLAISQVIAGVVLTLIQAGVIISVARFAFGADYGASLPQFFVLVVVAAVFFNSIGLFLGMTARRFPALDLIVTIAIPAMTFIGGGFVKLDLGGIRDLSINTIFQRAMFNQISGIGVDWNPLYVCLAIGIAALLGSAVLLKKPEGR